jgi:putative flippase GtrA
MGRRLLRFGAVTVVPTLVDVGLLVLLRISAGWILVAANLTAIAVASLLSYVLHRRVTFRSDPYVRWVEQPAVFVVVASAAALTDTLVLRTLYAGHAFDTTGGLLAAKAVALGAAATVRLVGYRMALLETVRHRESERVARPPARGDLRFSVVIPALDEEARIGATVAEVRAGLASLVDDGVEIIVVDDGSTDGTADAALVAGADQVVVQPQNAGKGAAVRAGVLAARGRAIAFTDADLSYSPDQLLTILAGIEDGWDVVVGNRRHPDTVDVVRASTLRSIGSQGINLLTAAVLLASPRDTQCGLKGFRSDVGRFIFRRAHIDGFAFDIEVLHLVERHRLSLLEVPVRLVSSERSTVRVARDAARLIRDLFRIRHLAAIGAYEVVADDELFNEPASRTH